MVWRNCKAGIKLVGEVDARWPKRDRSSDGSIGDASHQTRDSDHNPWVVVNGVGVVRARDIDEDLDGNQLNTGADAVVLFEHLLRLAKGGDIRLNGGGYLIYEAHIYSERLNWAARPYSGTNAHKHHLHVSFSRNIAGFDSTASWGINTVQKPTEIGPLMALTNDQQRELLASTRETNMRVEQIQKILLGDDPNGKGDTQVRELASLTRLERHLDIIDDQVEA